MRHLLTFICFCLFFTGYSQSITDSLKVHYKFDQNIFDDSQNENHLNLAGGQISFNQISNGDYSAIFNGNLRLNTNFDNSEFQENTVSLWFKSSTITSNLQIMLQGAYMGFGLYIAPNTGKVLGFFDGGSPGALISERVLTDNKWHHIVLSTSGNKTTMFVDGVKNKGIEEMMVNGNGRSNNELYLGRSDLGIQPFQGELNDVRIYNRVLNKAEVELLNNYPYTYRVPYSRRNRLTEIKFFPNPVYNFIQITSEGDNEYQIIDLNGRIIDQGEESKINVSFLEPGLYLIRLKDGVFKSFIKA